MFSIISSEVVSDRLQIDGRRHIHERHTDSAGQNHSFFWVAEPEQNVNSILTQRAETLPDVILRNYEDQEVGNGLYN